MLDPGLEHMHRHGRAWRASIQRRRLLSEALADLLLLIPIGLLFLFAGGGEWAAGWEVTLLVGACAVASMVRFEVGSGSTSPHQLVTIPMWFAVPPPWLPVLIGLSFVLGGVLEHWRDQNREPLWRNVFNAGDAWPAIGPAVVFAVAGSPAATLDVLPLVLVAFLAQVVVDVVFTVGFGWLVHGVPPRMLLRMSAWINMTDAGLAPIGYLVAVVSQQQPGAVIALLPLIAVIGEFARERRERLEQALQLSTTYRGTAQLMGDVLEADDAYTGGEHTQGVVDMAVAVGLELRLEPREMRDLEFGALLHDIGKLRVPNEIINKPGSLSASEWEVIRQHPIYGQEMLDRVGGAMTDAGRIVRAHHERWDGSGYPDGLAGDEIPLPARIITVCDSFSAMTTTRSYSAAKSHDEGLIELQRCSGTQFDPVVVEMLYRVLARDPSLVQRAASSGSTNTSAVAAGLGLRPIA
ncbi:MAG: HD-GYP domain-containing protein [Thermoleophilaceae bacterium]|nr:HD-GYP domain-containing protein [Thermoleophilaceae bacterium]